MAEPGESGEAWVEWRSVKRVVKPGESGGACRFSILVDHYCWMPIVVNRLTALLLGTSP